jgi:hypothetical protein
MADVHILPGAADRAPVQQFKRGRLPKGVPLLLDHRRSQPDAEKAMACRAVLAADLTANEQIAAKYRERLTWSDRALAQFAREELARLIDIHERTIDACRIALGLPD